MLTCCFFFVLVLCSQLPTRNFSVTMYSDTLQKSYEIIATVFDSIKVLLPWIIMNYISLTYWAGLGRRAIYQSSIKSDSWAWGQLPHPIKILIFTSCKEELTGQTLLSSYRKEIMVLKIDWWNIPLLFQPIELCENIVGSPKYLQINKMENRSIMTT